MNKGQTINTNLSFSFPRGFAATAGEKVYDSLQTWTQSNGATIEEDQVVKIDSN